MSTAEKFAQLDHEEGRDWVAPTEPWESFSQTWPAWGMTRGGEAFALPTPVPLTDVSACSSSRSLPTPTARDGRGQNQRRDMTCLPGAVEGL